MKHPEVPSFFYRLFKWFCKNDLFEELEGDLEERFIKSKKSDGLRKARRMYAIEVVKMLRPVIVKKEVSRVPQIDLVASFTLLAIRNLRKNKVFS